MKTSFNHKYKIGDTVWLYRVREKEQVCKHCGSEISCIDSIEAYPRTIIGIKSLHEDKKIKIYYRVDHDDCLYWSAETFFSTEKAALKAGKKYHNIQEEYCV